VELIVARFSDPLAGTIAPPAHRVILTVLLVPSAGSNAQPQTPAAKLEQLVKVSVPGNGIVQPLSAHASMTSVVPKRVAETGAVPSAPVLLDVLRTLMVSFSAVPMPTRELLGST